MRSTIQSLSDADLLGVLVGTRTAAHLLKDASGSLAQLLHEPVPAVYAQPRAASKLQAARELVRRSLAEQMQQRDVLASPQAVRDYLRVTLAHLEHEVFMALFLDAQHRVIAAEELFRGTLTQTAVYPREVARRALELNCASIILAHNHPSGVAEPSPADRLLTSALRAALSPLDIPVLDHLIVAGNRCYSFAESGLL
jgi:DNA repair protein RadC